MTEWYSKRVYTFWFELVALYSDDLTKFIRGRENNAYFSLPDTIKDSLKDFEVWAYHHPVSFRYWEGVLKKYQDQVSKKDGE